MESRPLVTQIQRFSVNDGPGFRTIVFFKGCSLRCQWCHNPETQSFSPEIYWKSRLCVQCGHCFDVCPNQAIFPPIPPEEAQREDSTYYKIDKARCDGCMKCVEACSYGALELVGKPMSMEEIVEELERDRPFYDNSGGGVTISGGEPLVYGEFIRKLMDALKARSLHICLDTSGHSPWEILEPVAERADMILYDLKHLDSEAHERLTGVPNQLILHNLQRLAAKGCRIWLRIVVLPGCTDSIDYHRRVVAFLRSLPGSLERIDLLPFHNWCQDKYRWLGRPWSFGETESVHPDELEPLLELYLSAGLNATIGGSGFEAQATASG